ncbi:DUF3088 family protein [Bradyrhizobium septentrionale]|uniref:DUF3088 family protein n=1 Tax=Bradyrhizobium TaxID=374 RepID=UPI001C071625
MHTTPRDQLRLLERPFADPAFPGQEFYCWQCAVLEGVLSAFPSRATNLDLHRIAWLRPRTELIERLGPDHQSVPVLIFEKGSVAPGKCGIREGVGLCRRSFYNPASLSSAPRISGPSSVKTLPRVSLLWKSTRGHQRTHVTSEPAGTVSIDYLLRLLRHVVERRQWIVPAEYFCQYPPPKLFNSDHISRVLTDKHVD